MKAVGFVASLGPPSRNALSMHTQQHEIEDFQVQAQDPTLHLEWAACPWVAYLLLVIEPVLAVYALLAARCARLTVSSQRMQPLRQPSGANMQMLLSRSGESVQLGSSTTGTLPWHTRLRHAPLSSSSGDFLPLAAYPDHARLLRRSSILLTGASCSDDLISLTPNPSPMQAATKTPSRSA